MDDDTSEQRSDAAGAQGAERSELARTALALVQMQLPKHLDDKNGSLALLGARALPGSLEKVYRYMARLLHPDKHPNRRGEFEVGFKLLGAHYDNCKHTPARDVKLFRQIPWRFDAEHELHRAHCQSHGMPEPVRPPPPPPSPASESTEEEGAGRPRVLQLIERCNLTAMRMALDLKALRSLRMAGDGSMTWATAMQEYIDKLLPDTLDWHGVKVASFYTDWYESDRSKQMGYEGRLQCDTVNRSSFGLPRVLQELFRIGLKVANLDQCTSHFISIMDLLAELKVDANQFPDVRAVALARDKYVSALKGHPFIDGMDADEVKKLLISIVYQCKLNPNWPQSLKDLHAQIQHIVNLNARRRPADVAVAESWGKKRPKLTAFSYRLCYFERLDMNRMLSAGGDASMCYEYDGLVLFTEANGSGLDEAVDLVTKASERPLKIKAYAHSFQEWLEHAAARYPAEDWLVRSKFPWHDVLLATTSVKKWLADSLDCEATGTRNPRMPETDIALIVSAELECFAMVHGSHFYFFNGIKWITLDVQNGLHSIIKRTLQTKFRTQDSVYITKDGKWFPRLRGQPLPFAKAHDVLVKVRMEVAPDLHVMQLPEFDKIRGLLSGSNGLTLNCDTMKLGPTHWSTFVTKTLAWPLHPWEHPLAGEYLQVVKEITDFWKRSGSDARPDLLVVKSEPKDDDEEEAAVLHFGHPQLAARFKKVCQGIEYLRIRLQSCKNNVDLCIYKEQWIARVIGCVAHLCELLYCYGPPGSGKDVDALFLQEFFAPDFVGTIPTTDVVKMPGQQERGVEGSTPSMAALSGKRVGLVAEVPQGEFAWHRLKHFVEQQGIRPNTRANNKAPTASNPTYAIMLWSNYAPNMGNVEGAHRRTAVVHLDARYGATASEEDGQYVDDNGLKYRIQQGDFRQDMLWTALAWISALRTYSTSIPKPAAVRHASQDCAPDPLKAWAEEYPYPPPSYLVHPGGCRFLFVLVPAKLR